MSSFKAGFLESEYTAGAALGSVGFGVVAVAASEEVAAVVAFLTVVVASPLAAKSTAGAASEDGGFWVVAETAGVAVLVAFLMSICCFSA